MKFIRRVILVSLVFFIVNGCNISTSGIFKNEQIEAGIRKEIKPLNDQFFQALFADDMAKARSLMSDDLLKVQSEKEMHQLLRQLRDVLQSKKYHVLDEYYVRNLKSDVHNSIPSARSDDGAYEIGYKALDKEMYSSLLLPDGLKHDALVLLVYGKKGTGWKINIVQFGQYSLFKKTAPEYYKLAKGYYQRSELIDAADHIILAKQCLKPGGNFFVYKKEKEISDFYDKVLKEANAKYSLPKTLEEISSKPQLFLVTPESFEDGVFPLVCYVSKINIGDTTALKKENEQVKIEVNKLFYGINKNKKRVLYRVYNEMPEAKKEVHYYGFVDELTD